MIDMMTIPIKPYFVQENEALKNKVEQLEKEADWLASHFVNICAFPEIKTCTDITDEKCIKCWRKVAQEAVL